ncbi:MAG: phosphotransferase [Candidatus Paceibacterota bacterium]|jgi:Ser/Thr protein kinase RdoA (MazF antagonist)
MYKKLVKNQTTEIVAVLKQYNFVFSNISIYRNTTANNNRIFLVKNGKNKFILRESNKSKVLKHLELEIEILQHLYKKGFGLTPYIIPNTHNSFITICNNKYYMLENLLPGDVKAEVNNLTQFNNRKLLSLFESLAKFTKEVEKFDNPIPKDNKPLFYYVKNGKELFTNLLTKVKSSTTKDVLIDNTDFVNNFIEETERRLLAVGYDKLKKQIVHFDLHPGNVNYVKDKITGIFDFDWVRYDHRITDLACTLGQSCYAYKGKGRALYNKEKLHLGLESYQKAYGKSEIKTGEENMIILAALRGYMFFQLLWIIEWSINYPKNLKSNEYVRFSIDVLKLNDFDRLLN